MCAVNALKCTLPRYTRTIFIIIGARRKIIIPQFDLNYRRCAPRASNSFLVFPGNKSKSDFIKRCYSRCVLSVTHAVVYCILYSDSYTTSRIEHCIIIRRYTYKFTYRLHTHSNISFIRTSTLCCTSESTLWIRIPNMIRRLMRQLTLTRSYYFAT